MTYNVFGGTLNLAQPNPAYGPADATAIHYLLLQQIQIGFTFLVPAYLGSPGQSAINQVYVIILLLLLSDRVPRKVLRY